MFLHLHMETQILYALLRIQTVRYLFFCFNQYLFNGMGYICLYFTNFSYCITRRVFCTTVAKGSNLKCVLASKNKTIIDAYQYGFNMFDMVIEPLQIGKLICCFHRIDHGFQRDKVRFSANCH